MFRSRIINVLVGCVVGLVFVVIGGPTEWKLPFALGVDSPHLVICHPHPDDVAQAPITAAIVIAAGLAAHSELSAVEHGLHKVAEVLFGCFVA